MKTIMSVAWLLAFLVLAWSQAFDPNNSSPNVCFTGSNLIATDRCTVNVTCSGDITAGVNSAITALPPAGGTVNIGAGSCSMSSAISVSNKQLTIQGQGQGVTNIDISAAGFGTFTYSSTNLPLFRLTGMSFSLTGLGGAARPIQIDTTAKGQVWSGGWRIDHIDIIWAAHFGGDCIRIFGPTWGLIDHSTFSWNFESCVISSLNLYPLEDATTVDKLLGAYGATLPYRPGASDYVYLEDNVFSCNELIYEKGGCAMVDTDYSGCRNVMRHNTTINIYLYAHWTSKGNVNSCWWELYQNNMSWTIGNETGNTTASTAAGNSVLSFGAGMVPGGVTTGLTVMDETHPTVIPTGTTVMSINSGAGTVTLSASVVAPGVGSGDKINFDIINLYPGRMQGGGTGLVHDNTFLGYQTKAILVGDQRAVSGSCGDTHVNGPPVGCGVSFAQVPVTISSGSPAHITFNAADLNMAVQTPVVFSGGTLPAAITAGVTYYVTSILTVTNANDTVTISATQGGSNINTASASTGTVTITASPEPWDGNFGDPNAPGWPLYTQAGRQVGPTPAQIAAGTDQTSFPFYMWNNGPQQSCSTGSGSPSCGNDFYFGTSGPPTHYYLMGSGQLACFQGMTQFCGGHIAQGMGNPGYGDMDVCQSATQPSGCGTHTLTYTPWTYPYPLKDNGLPNP